MRNVRKEQFQHPLELAKGLEPLTTGLQNQSSTN